jgi:hypothetical protein
VSRSPHPCSQVALLAVLAIACATPAVAPEPQALAPSDRLGRSFFLRQRITARIEARSGQDAVERHFETALQSRCGELRLVGFTRFGMRLWSAVSRDGEIEVETFGGRPLPFPPERVLRDVERTFFWSPPMAPDPKVTRTLVQAGESVRETWRDGVLAAREFRPLGAPDAQPVVILYSGATGPLDIAPEVALSNPAVGYALAIENHAIEELSCPDDED